jgi:adenylylsulfate kinase
MRRIAYVSKLFNENGNFVVTSFVSPTNEYRRMIKEIIGNVKLVFVKCSLETCEERDVKGMYKKARNGEIKDFTGISAPFEEPLDADIVVDTEHNSIEDCVKEILENIGAQKIKKHEFCSLGKR